MDMIIDFPGGSRVDAHFGAFTVHTDQPAHGGGDEFSAHALRHVPGLHRHAGIYVLGFCRQRGLPTDGLRLVQSLEVDCSTGLVAKVQLDIQVPAGFPEKYRAALIRSAEQCAVKKHLEHPPVFEVSTHAAEAATA